MQIAVDLARTGAGPGQRVAGSVAPLEDCYRPDLSPAEAGEEHQELAQALARSGVDLLICETFPHLGEAVLAVKACVETGLETWAALTPGPEADLLTPSELARGAQQAREAGASVVLVNCVSAALAGPYVDSLADQGQPFGVYANAGAPEACLGWETEAGEAAAAYGVFAAQWLARGACVVGSCCGTGPAHIEALATLLEGP
jgi:S-methylmethionine-dependent homocysteine/selenocysteine methylase